jgi:hypothetical protein
MHDIVEHCDSVPKTCVCCMTCECMKQGEQQLHMQTKPNSQDHEAAERRQAIRETWLPRVQGLAGITAKFVVGRTSDKEDEAALQEEIQQHPDEFLVLDMHVCPFMVYLLLLPHFSFDHLNKQQQQTYHNHVN